MNLVKFSPRFRFVVSPNLILIHQHFISTFDKNKNVPKTVAAKFTPLIELETLY